MIPPNPTSFPIQINTLVEAALAQFLVPQQLEATFSKEVPEPLTY